MKRNVVYLFPVISILSIVVAFIFPIVTYKVTPSSFDSFLIYGFGFLDLTVINILDTPFIIISFIIVVLLFFVTSSIFLERKYPARLKIISNIWLWSGIGILVLSLLWILIWNTLVNFFAPYGFTFEFTIVLPFVGGMLLISGRIYTFVFSKKTRE